MLGYLLPHPPPPPLPLIDIHLVNDVVSLHMHVPRHHTNSTTGGSTGMHAARCRLAGLADGTVGTIVATSRNAGVRAPTPRADLAGQVSSGARTRVHCTGARQRRVCQAGAATTGRHGRGHDRMHAMIIARTQHRIQRGHRPRGARTKRGHGPKGDTERGTRTKTPLRRATCWRQTSFQASASCSRLPDPLQWGQRARVDHDIPNHRIMRRSCPDQVQR